MKTKSRELKTKNKFAFFVIVIVLSVIACKSKNNSTSYQNETNGKPVDQNIQNGKESNPSKGEGSFDKLGIGNVYQIVYSYENDEENELGNTESYIGVVNSDGTGKVVWQHAPGFSPTWSADGKRIAFVGMRHDSGSVDEPYIINADGSGKTEAFNGSWYTACYHLDWSNADGWLACDAYTNTNINDTDNYSDEILIFRPQIDSNLSNVTFLDYSQDRFPNWSPNGKKLAYCAQDSELTTIVIIDTETWGKTYIYQNIPKLKKMNLDCDFPGNIQWSPDSQKILTKTEDDKRIFLIDLSDNSTSYLTEGSYANWSPDGNRITYSNDGIWTMKSDGSDKKRLTTMGFMPLYSPDGSMILFAHHGGEPYGLAIMNSDGSNIIWSLADFSGENIGIEWSPIPIGN